MKTEFVNKLEELKQLVISEDNVDSERIGIGITTHNRRDMFIKTYNQIVQFAPPGAKIVVVDDASDIPTSEADFYFRNNTGIARAKNKCFELLYAAGCEHFFLFDDDCYPITEKWYRPYVDSTEPHLNYIFKEFKGQNKPMLNDTALLYSNSKIRAYSHVRGCMCYYKRICLDVCGGMSPAFGRWGYEHPDLSNRIYNAGLTTFRYMDVPDSDRLFYSHDEHNANEGSTVMGDERAALIRKNSILYDARKNICEYVEFREKENIVLTCYFTQIKDTQRDGGDPLPAEKEPLIPLIESTKRKSGAKLIILNDCLNYNLETYVRVETSINNVYFQRWVNLYKYLQENKKNINKVFITDATDVIMLRNPFPDMVLGKLYVGDEAEITGCEWMKKYNHHRLIKEFIEKNERTVLLNAGLLGGDVGIVMEFIGKFLSFYFQAVSDSHFNPERPDCGLFDMGLFNYIARTHFNDRLVHGNQVNTEFKANKANNVSWFKHK